MSTDLATIATQMPAHLRQATGDDNEFAAGIGESFPLPFLSIRGKEFRFRKDGQEVNTRAREMNVVLVAARNNVSKRFYAKKYEGGSDDAPDCSSLDGKTPDVAEPVSDRCDTCPNNAWGSKITESGKEGKACSDYKRLIVWPLETLPDYTPVLDLSATNMRFSKEQRKDRAEMDFKTYVEMLQKHGMKPHQVVTSIAFTDAEYPQLCFGFVRFTTEDEWAKVQELRESEDFQTVLNTDVHTGETEVIATDKAPEKETAKAESKPKAEPKARAESKPKAAAKPKAEEKPADDKVYLMDEDGEEVLAVSGAKAAKLEKAGFQRISKKMYDKLSGVAETAEPEAKAEEPEAEAAPAKEAPAKAEAEGPDDDDEALMNEIAAMFGGKG